MSLLVNLSLEAWRDLDELETYLSDRFSSRNARTYVRRIFAACDRIGLAPHRGNVRNEIGPGVRSIGFESRIEIIFEVNPDSVVILGLLYAGRQTH